MASQLLFYDAVFPVSSTRHRQWAVETTRDFRFAAETNSVPLMGAEFARAALEYPIVFAGNEGKVMPVAMLGVENNINLYVNEQGEWQSRYIPAYVRRYPFIFSSTDEGKTFTLCLEESYPGLNQDGRGNRLFDDEGEQSQYLKGVMKFLQDYQAEFNRTRMLCEKLKELDVLEPMQAQLKLKSGKQVSLTGFQTISREKLHKLEPEVLSKLIQNGAMELIHVHFLSLQHFQTMMTRVAVSMDEKSGEADSSETEARELAEASPTA